MNARKTAAIEVNARKAVGKIKRLHGTNLGPHLLNDMPNVRDYGEDLKALEIPLMRLHDAPLDNRGRLLVDIPMVFPLFHADPSDPRNYYFKQTDDYIEGCLETGAKILYRLGVSIEHTKNKYLTAMPQDFEKWTEICANVIRHYNEGWADGFNHGIEYWEIWNEADLGPKMWSGTWKDYVELYVTASKRLKELFPQIKIGGPAMCWLREKLIAEMLSTCKKRQAPLDFFSWHGYSANPQDLIDAPSKAREILDSYGFSKTELNLNEWHYYPGDWAKMNTDREHLKWLAGEMGGSDSAAFTAAVLSGWQDSPLDSANFYTGTDLSGFWGIFDSFGARNKCYYALKAFNALAGCERRLQAGVDGASKGVWALAGGRKDGGTEILVSLFKPDAKALELKMNGGSLEGCKVSILDSSRDLVETSEFEASKEVLKLGPLSGSSTILIQTSKQG